MAGAAEPRPAFPGRVFCDTSYFLPAPIPTTCTTGGLWPWPARRRVFRRHGRDHRLSFCDAISFAVVTALLEHMPCFALDEDFRRLGLTVIATPR